MRYSCALNASHAPSIETRRSLQVGLVARTTSPANDNLITHTLNHTPMSESFDGYEEVKAKYFKLGKPGDYIRGTYIELRKGISQLPGKEGEPTLNYVTKVLDGFFHDGEDKIILEKGSVWTVSGRITIDEKMKDVKIGQQFIVQYVEDKPSKKKGFQPQKVTKVLKGAMDPDFGMDEVKEDPSFLMNA